MKKLCVFFIVLVSAFSSKTNGDSYKQYVSRSYVVVDALNNKALEGKNINLKRSVASISKIMTAIIALEEGNLEKEYTVTKDDLKTYGSSIYLQDGENITLLDLVYGLMLRSGNDASLVIARVVGGSKDTFVEKMNMKAKELGMNNSYFSNPNGLDEEDEGNISTSYDMAILMSYALKNKLFREIISTKEYRKRGRWKNKNKLLFSYDKLIGGKTGFTYKARRTLVTAAEDRDTTLVVVTLDCGNDFNFHKFLYERNFDNYETIQLLEKGEHSYLDYLIISDKDLFYTIDKKHRDEYKIVYVIDKDSAIVYLYRNEYKERIGVTKAIKMENKKDNIWSQLFK